MNVPTKEDILIIITQVALIVRNNIKLLLRAKASTLLIILGPLFLIFFAGIAYDNTNLYSVTIGTYSPSYNSLSQSFLQKLTEKQFKTEPYPNEEACIQALQEGDIHTCIIFAANFTLARNASNEITFYLDYSKLNLVWAITSVINEQISSRSKELSTNLTNEVIKALDYTKQQLQKRKQSLATLIAYNDEASKQLYDISAHLEEVTFQLSADDLGITNLTLQKGRVQHWVENSVNLGDQALQNSLKYMNAVDDLIKASSASPDLKTNIHEYLKTTVTDIETLQGRMKTTKDLLGQQSTEFDALINAVLTSFNRIKNQLDVAAQAKTITLEQLNTIRTLLDKALINVLEVQKSLTDIENVVSSVRVTDPGSIVQPIVTTIKPIAAEKSYLNYLFPTLIVLVLMYTALLLTPILILLERNSPAYLRQVLSPVNDTILLLSTFSTSALLLLIQLFVILFVATIFFSSHILTSLFITLLICALTIGFFTFVGMVVGYLFTTEEAAVLASTTLATAFLFLSDVILPIESMAPWLGSIAHFNPFVITSTLLRKTIVLNTTIGAFWTELLLLLFYCALAGALAVGAYYALKQNTLAKYAQKLAPVKEYTKVPFTKVKKLFKPR